MRTSHTSAGFSFVELCIAVMVIGILIAGFLAGYMVYAQKQRYDITRERSAALQYALDSYVQTHKRLPCPANPTAALMSAGVGKEVSCAAGASAPTGIQVIGSGSNTIWKGAVPAATLRMSAESAVDGWGNRFTYVVSRKLTEPNGQAIPTGETDRPFGVIKIVNTDGEDLLDTDKRARFLIISAGPTGKGAFTQQGVQRSVPAGTKDAENYDNNDTFVLAALTRKEGDGFYDDLLIHDELVKGTPDPREPIMICNSQNMFFNPTSPDANEDGCVGLVDNTEIITRIVTCNNKGGIYSQNSANADTDGCIIVPQPPANCPTNQVLGIVGGQIACVPVANTSTAGSGSLRGHCQWVSGRGGASHCSTASLYPTASAYSPALVTGSRGSTACACGSGGTLVPTGTSAGSCNTTTFYSCYYRE